MDTLAVGGESFRHDSGRGADGQMELQLDWDIDRLKSGWVAGPDTAFITERLSTVPADVTAAGEPRRVLEVAAAEAVHSCKLNRRGVESFVVEPSPVMLERARERMVEYGAKLALVRGVAETLPFRDHTFDRVLLDSAIDHLGNPELGIREMARVLRPDGRLVISFVNYESFSARFSRTLYGIARRLRVAAPRRNWFWDSPVPLEHTFECTFPVLQ
ncbi:MAG TPA: class I SAM-dependent methyltransferase, partial [Solirubrobacteraceae bacterium]|nr:class I SAM-dependent methyltransferase [Solirubrobacteraceae bacterium]